VFVLLGLALTFVTLAAPVQLEGNHITLFWAAEAVLLLWLSRQSGIRMMRYSSAILIPLTIISLVMDFYNIYMMGDPALLELMPLLNRGFLTAGFTVFALVVYLRLLRDVEGPVLNGLSANDVRVLAYPLLGGFAFLTGLLELWFQGQQYIALDATRMLVNTTYIYSGLAGLCWWVHNRASAGWRQGMIAVTFIAMLSYLPLNASIISVIRNSWIAGGEGSLWQFGFHYALLGLLIVVGRYMLLFTKEAMGLRTNTGALMAGAASIAGLIIATMELDHYWVIIGYGEGAGVHDLLRSAHRTGMPILWGLYSFGLMIVGMRQRFKPLRILSLALFTLTLLKLFLFDIRNVPPGAKIAAFICLGGLLLVISFLYQRLKTLVFGDDAPSAEPQEA